MENYSRIISNDSVKKSIENIIDEKLIPLQIQVSELECQLNTMIAREDLTIKEIVRRASEYIQRFYEPKTVEGGWIPDDFCTLEDYLNGLL